MRSHLLAIALGLGALAAPHAAHAALQTCSLTNYRVEVVEYWHAPANFDVNEYRCDWDTGRCSMRGWMLSAKNQPANSPAVIFEHGSGGSAPLGESNRDEQSLTSYSCPIKAFLDAGYVVYMPYRRGTFDTTLASTLPASAASKVGWSNSGWALIDYANMRMGDDVSSDNLVRGTLEYMQIEADDLIPVLNTLHNYSVPGIGKLVDPTRVAVAGHSYGGAFVTIASTNSDLYAKTTLRTGPRAFISLSGAAMSYHGSHWWHDYMVSAAAVHNAAIMFTRVLDEDSRSPNDFASAREPFDAATGVGTGARLNTYAAINATCNAGVSTWQCAHTTFVTNSDQIAKWFPDVREFLDHKGM